MADLPVLIARGESIPEAWENSIVNLHQNGLRYKRDDPDDNGKEQVGARMIIEITNPVDAKLLGHRFESGMTSYGAPGFFEYVMEMLGAKDSWTKREGQPTLWDYTYHGRLANYRGIHNQIEFIISRLAERPYSRRTNAITWDPEPDMTAKDTPCLQRIWFEEIANSDGSSDLNMNYNFRSRNAMIAAPDNMKGIVFGFGAYIVHALRKRTDRDVRLGSVVEFTDNYHVSPRNRELMEKFVKDVEKSKGKGESIDARAFTKEQYTQNLLQDRDEVLPRIIEKTKELCPPEKLQEEIDRIQYLGQLVLRLVA
jgi:thymidylate synthase